MFPYSPAADNLFQPMAASDQRLSKSKYLNVLTKSGKNKALLYHSLFGNLHLLDASYLTVIDLFSTPLTWPEALSSLPSFESSREIVEELLRLYYLVPEGFDERTLTQDELALRYEKLKTGELIHAVQLNVSEGCNLKCTYCFADRVDERSTLYTLNSRNQYKMMATATAIEAINSITSLVRKNGGSTLIIKFFGREPLLNWNAINEVIDYCELHKDSFHYSYVITTNGTLFTPEIVERLKSVNTGIVVSLDGFIDDNSLRLTHTGKETFSLVDSGLNLLKQHKVSCGVATVLSSRNFLSLGNRFIEYLKSRSVRQWEIKLAMQHDGDMKYSASEYAGKLYQLYRLGEQADILVTGDWYDPFVTLFHTTKHTTDESVHRLAPNSCSATDHQLSIEPSGGIFGCRALDSKLGDVGGLDALLQSTAYRRLSMRTYYNVPFCHGCKLEGFCQGVCLGHSEKKFNDIYQPDDDYCNVYREVFDLLLSHFAETRTETR